MKKSTNIMLFFIPLFSLFFILFFSLYGLCEDGNNSSAASGLKSEKKNPDIVDNSSLLLDQLIGDIDKESYKLEPQVSSSSIRGSTAKAGEEEPVPGEPTESSNTTGQQLFQDTELFKRLKEIRAIGDIVQLSALAVHIHFLEYLSKTVDADFNSRLLLTEAAQKLQEKPPNLRSKKEVKSVLLAYIEIMGTKKSDQVLSGKTDSLLKGDEKYQKRKKEIITEFEEFKEESK